MGKDKNPRRVADNEAMAKLRMLRMSPQKLNHWYAPGCLHQSWQTRL